MTLGFKLRDVNFKPQNFTCTHDCREDFSKTA